MAASDEKHSYWRHLAAAYHLLESPLRPCAEDIHILETIIDNWAASRASTRFRCLLLGATPDIAQMRRPRETTLIAADNSLPMMQAVWPGDTGRSFGICANWQHLPLPCSSVHIAIGDGSLNCVRHPDEARNVCRSLRCILDREGLLVLRCYARPEETEAPEQVFGDMFRGGIPTFTQFRFRLFLAMRQSLDSGLAVDDVYRLWASYSIDVECLAKVTGWPMAAIRTMEGCRNSGTVHTFPTLAQFRSLLDPYFQETAVIMPSYPLGEHCPMLVLRPRPESV